MERPSPRAPPRSPASGSGSGAPTRSGSSWSKTATAKPPPTKATTSRSLVHRSLLPRREKHHRRRRNPKPGRKSRSTQRPLHIHGPDHHRPLVHHQRQTRNANRRTPQKRPLVHHQNRPVHHGHALRPPPHTHHPPNYPHNPRSRHTRTKREPAGQPPTGCLITPKVEVKRELFILQDKTGQTKTGSGNSGQRSPG